MERKIPINKYIELFEKLLAEKDSEKQKAIARKIADYSGTVNDEIEKKYWDEPLHRIQNSCLAMEHWKDGTGYCGLTKKDINLFLGQLKEQLK